MVMRSGGTVYITKKEIQYYLDGNVYTVNEPNELYQDLQNRIILISPISDILFDFGFNNFNNYISSNEEIMFSDDINNIRYKSS